MQNKIHNLEIFTISIGPKKTEIIVKNLDI